LNKLCPICGKEFTTRSNVQKYCSRKCKNDYQSRFNTEDEKIVKEFEEIIREPMYSWLRRKYIDEKWTYREIMVELGMNENARRLKRMLEHFGIPIRDSSEAVKLQHERDKSRREIFKKVIATESAKIKKAIGNQRNRKHSTLEKAAKSIFKYFGFSPISEYAVWIYNIDFAFPDIKLAVEIDGGNWHTSDKKIEIDGEKQDYLLSQGWEIKRYKAEEFDKLMHFLADLKHR
jgi:very-short-patch-repair endonuclease/endogenous inhibitor of DNA gyrase (YacG/DUF329 family)